MTAGAEHEPRVKAQRHTAVQVRLLPLGHNDEPVAYLERLIILLPVIFPVCVIDNIRLKLKAGIFYLLQHRFAALIKIQLYAGDTGVPIFKLLVNIVPVLAVVFEKRAEIRLVFDDIFAQAEGAELIAAFVDAAFGGFDDDLCIFHVPSLKLPRP